MRAMNRCQEAAPARLSRKEAAKKPRRSREKLRKAAKKAFLSRFSRSPAVVSPFAPLCGF
jgi:hypothetical protein